MIYICFMDDVKELKVTFGGHIRMIGFTLLIYAFFVFIAVYSCIYSLKPKLLVLIFMIVIPFVFLILPVLYVHYQYSKCSDEIFYKLNKNVSITQTSSSGEKIFNVDEFEQFKFVLTKSKLVKTPSKMMFSDYNYLKLKLKTGEELTFTCLYSSDLYTLFTSYFPDIPITTEGVFYPNISEMDFE